MGSFLQGNEFNNLTQIGLIDTKDFNDGSSF